jgi:hypothetical protein
MARSDRALVPLAAGLLLLTGCAHTGISKDGDPLWGGGPPLPSGRPGDAVAQAKGAPARDAPNGPLPELPAPSGATSQAALASDPPPQLRIPGGDAWRSPGKKTASAVPLQQPEPLTQAQGQEPGPGAGPAVVPLGAPSQKPPTPTVGVRLDTYPQIQEALAARGVTRQRLEMVGDQGEWKFTCSVANRRQPDVLHTVEAQAFGEGGLAAMRAAVQRLEAEAP